MDTSFLQNLDFSDPEFADTITNAMENRSSSSVFWVMALDEVTAGCLAEAVLTARDRTGGMVCWWPVDLTGRTVLDGPRSASRSTTNLVPVDLSTNEAARRFVADAREVLKPGDLLAVCGMCNVYGEKIREELMMRCEAWGVTTVWGGPRDSLPTWEGVDLVIDEIPLAGTGCTSARVGDFLSELATRFENTPLEQLGPRDNPEWCLPASRRKESMFVEVKEIFNSHNVCVRTMCGDKRIFVTDWDDDLSIDDLLVLDTVKEQVIGRAPSFV